ncbi:MAG: Xaa-Pro aminopeptidase [Methylococcaceae bacterium]|nr:Xaa-Pro aminopeptidase [Methylococcaceae bacterium]MCI0732504.1 Xaa-Pro aminopeptidase [Methylococcaceae bacterium]
MANSEYRRRRKEFMRMVGTGNIALIASAPVSKRNNDVDYPYRQDSDFVYLTGFEEPKALAVFVPGRRPAEYILFCREFDATMALWTGHHAGIEGAKKLYEADDAFPIDDVDEILPGLMENKARVFYPMGRNGELDHQVLEWVKQLRQRVRSGISAPMEFVAIENLLHEMRLYKTAAELKLMRRAANVSAKAHIRAMRAARAGLYEHQIEAELLHEFTHNGMRSTAYPSIVAGGRNACVLHYTQNRDKLQDGDLLLIDAGAENQNYASDVTRTFPVSGRFSEAQKLLYQLVLDAQLAAIAKVRPGNHWDDPHDAAIKVLTRGLVDFGLLKGRISNLIKNEAYKKFYMHRTGHWLGMDVHDVGNYKVDGRWRLLEPGMVLTVEPGLYVSADCTDVEKKWRGIGIRIEDDVLVTKDGCEVLTSGVPKTIAEIEELMA